MEDLDFDDQVGLDLEHEPDEDDGIYDCHVCGDDVCVCDLDGE